MRDVDQPDPLAGRFDDVAVALLADAQRLLSLREQDGGVGRAIKHRVDLPPEQGGDGRIRLGQLLLEVRRRPCLAGHRLARTSNTCGVSLRLPITRRTGAGDSLTSVGVTMMPSAEACAG